MHCKKKLFIFYHNIVYFVKSTLKIHAFQITQYFDLLHCFNSIFWFQWTFINFFNNC